MHIWIYTYKSAFWNAQDKSSVIEHLEWCLLTPLTPKRYFVFNSRTLISCAETEIFLCLVSKLVWAELYIKARKERKVRKAALKWFCRKPTAHQMDSDGHHYHQPESGPPTPRRRRRSFASGNDQRWSWLRFDPAHFASYNLLHWDVQRFIGIPRTGFPDKGALKLCSKNSKLTTVNYYSEIRSNK